MRELDIIHDEDDVYQRFRAYQNGKFSGELLAYPDDCQWVLEEIFTLSKRKGIGSALLRQFTAYVGENQVIEACLIHIPSIRAIRRNGLLPTVVTDEFIIQDTEKLSLLPMTKIFNRGNIDTTQLKFARFAKKGRERDILAFYVVYLYGITR